MGRLVRNLGALIFVVTSCSLDDDADKHRCFTEADCLEGRVCRDGTCQSAMDSSGGTASTQHGGAAGALGEAGEGFTGGISSAGGGSTEGGSGPGSSGGSSAEAGSAASAAGGGESAGAGGLASEPPPSCKDVPVTSVSGVRTAFPSIRYDFFNAGFQLVSVHFTFSDLQAIDGPLLQLFVEVKNVGSTLECNFSPDVTLDFKKITSVVSAAAYYDSTTVTNDCIAPGQLGVLYGNSRDVSQEAFAATQSLTIYLGPHSSGRFVEATDGPSLTTRVVPSGTGSKLAGQMTVRTPIYNYAMTVFARNPSGLLAARLWAFPGKLQPLASSAMVEFETEPSTCPFVDFLLFQSWIVQQ